MKNNILYLLLFLLTGCGATIIKPVNSNNPYAPLNESQSEGEVVYRLGRMDSYNESQRNDAYKKMYSQCNGKYIIVNEWTDNENVIGGFSTSNANATTNRNQAIASLQSDSVIVQDNKHYRHIVFKCAL